MKLLNIKFCDNPFSGSEGISSVGTDGQKSEFNRHWAGIWMRLNGRESVTRNMNSLHVCEDSTTNYTFPLLLLETEDLGRICRRVDVFMEYKQNSHAHIKRGEINS
jgi:hypothetical protein